MKPGLAALLKEWSETVLFASYSIFGFVESKDSKKAKGAGDEKRVLYTTKQPAFDAKNRSSLPKELDLSYAAYADALAKSRAGSSKDAVVARILALKIPATEIPKRDAAIRTMTVDKLCSLERALNQKYGDTK